MQLEGLDHVAIAVADPDATASWFRDVLGFERRFQDAWGDSPIFMMAGASGVAIFPRRRDSDSGVEYRGGSEFRHLAFRADRENFERARRELEARGIETEFEDHGVSHSIYFDDPDGFHLEITTYEIEATRRE